MPHILELAGSMIRLKLSSGTTWPVGFIKLNEKLVIKPGWDDFVNANDVSLNDLLVFKYVGGVDFEVLIFDPWGCEKSDIQEIIRNPPLPMIPGEKYNTSHRTQEVIEYSKATEISETETPAKKRPNQKSSKQRYVSCK
jgi:B3 DNA binding domain